MQKPEVTLTTMGAGNIAVREKFVDFDYVELLDDSFKIENDLDGDPTDDTKLTWLARAIFDIYTDDSEMATLMAKRAIEVCTAITTKTTIEYTQDREQYTWFLVMCNMPFFQDRLEWKESIRKAWWKFITQDKRNFHSYALWRGNSQIRNMEFSSTDEWVRFISAIVEFAMPEITA